MKIRRSVQIAAPPERVWPFLVEPEKIKKWFVTLEKFDYTSEQRTGVHIPIYFEEEFSNRHLEIHAVVDEWVQDRKIAIRAIRSNYPRRYDIGWAIEPTASGSTVTCVEYFEFPYRRWSSVLGLSFLGWIVIRYNVGRHLSELKRLVEMENEREPGR